MPDIAPKPTRGVPVQLSPDDQERRLRYTLATLEKIQHEYGEDAFSSNVGGMKLAKMLWYGLVNDDPTLTVEQVAELVDMEGIKNVTAAMTKAMGGKPEVTTGTEASAAEASPPQPPPATE